MLTISNSLRPTRPRSACAALGLMLIATLACHENPVAEWNGVKVEVKSGGLLVTNTTETRLAVYAADQVFDSQFPFTRCTDSSDACLRIPIGGNLLVPFDDIPGYAPHEPISVYTWTIDNGTVVEVADLLIAPR
jgi:hypothetical protein